MTIPGSGVFSEGSHDQPEDFQMVLRTNGGVRLVPRLEEEVPLVAGQVLHRELVVHDRHHDITLIGRIPFFDHDRVSWHDPGIDHRIPLDRKQYRPRRAFNQILVNAHGLGMRIVSCRATPCGAALSCVPKLFVLDWPYGLLSVRAVLFVCCFLYLSMWICIISSSLPP